MYHEDKMKKSIRDKLKIEKPEYYDLTDSRIAVIQDHKLKGIIHAAFKEGLKIGSIVGSLAFAISTNITLVSTEKFSDRFGFSAATWESIFILSAMFGWMAFVLILGRILLGWYRKGYLGEPNIEDMFKIQNKKEQAKKKKQVRRFVLSIPNRQEVHKR